jgi:hypothetical protein
VLIRSEAGICHPLADEPCPVLQYADDTIILLTANADGAARLRRVLDLFSEPTGFAINFSKSTVTPMHLPSGSLQEIMDILQCKVGSFSQTYHGLPLSNVKLPLSAFSPLIAKVDKYVASWQALLLSSAGRVVLINAVLTGVPGYAMGALLMPPGVVAAIDARRRAFLWTGTDKASGASCLVAWESVCTAKEDGSLGIKWIDT